MRKGGSAKLPPSAPALDAVWSEEHRRAAHVTQGRKKCRLHASLTNIQLRAPDTWLPGELVVDDSRGRKWLKNRWRVSGEDVPLQ